MTLITKFFQDNMVDDDQLLVEIDLDLQEIMLEARGTTRCIFLNIHQVEELAEFLSDFLDGDFDEPDDGGCE